MCAEICAQNIDGVMNGIGDVETWCSMQNK